MNDTISNLLLPTFSNAQKFLLTLLCGILFICTDLIILINAYLRPDKIIIEYYENKCTKENQEIKDLYDQNKSLQDEIMKLKTEIRFLAKANRNLSSKLRATNNMIRILTKTNENVDECKTLTKLNIHGIDKLLKEKTGRKALVSRNFNENLKQVKFNFDSNFKPQCNEANKFNNKSVTKSKTDEPKVLKNVLKNVENKKTTTSSLVQEKSRLLKTLVKTDSNPTRKNVIKEQKSNTEQKKSNAAQKSNLRNVPCKVATGVQPNKDTKVNSNKQDNNKLHDKTYILL